jgi:hypothetical protein
MQNLEHYGQESPEGSEYQYTTCSPCLLLLSLDSSDPNSLRLVCISNESDRARLAEFAALGDVVNMDASSMKEIESSTTLLEQLAQKWGSGHKEEVPK